MRPLSDLGCRGRTLSWLINKIMDDFVFKYPKKILQLIFVGAMLVAMSWGLITWNSQNAIDLWSKEVTFITKTILNYFTSRAERRIERVMKSLNSTSYQNEEAGLH
jgi:hypothetical protein